MQRNIYLEGELGTKFGAHMLINAPTVTDVLKLIDVNNPEFRPYLFECHEKGIDFAIDIAGEELEYAEELLLALHEGDVTITPIPEGGGGGFKKFLIAAAMLTAMAMTGGMGAPMSQMTLVSAGGVGSAPVYALTAGSKGFMAGLGSFAAMGGGLGAVAILGATSLAMTGLNEMMAPDPSVDVDEEQSYLFNGQQQNILEGDPVPVLYGELQVPGQPINFETENSAGRSTDSGRKDLIEYGITPVPSALTFSFP